MLKSKLPGRLRPATHGEDPMVGKAKLQEVQPQPLELIKEICRQAHEHSVSASDSRRLVQLLYLAELENRKSVGRPLTDLNWQVGESGAHADELAPVLGRLDPKLAGPGGGSQPNVPPRVSVILAELVRQWGAVNIKELLEHVSEAAAILAALDAVEKTQGALKGLDLNTIVWLAEDQELVEY